MADRETTESASLTESVEEQRRLIEKHRKCEERLGELRGRLFLSDEEKREEVNLKKQKLLLKDRIEILGRLFKERASGASG